MVYPGPSKDQTGQLMPFQGPFGLNLDHLWTENDSFLIKIEVF